MTYFIYTFTGALCNYFFCVHLLPNKLTILKRLIIFLYAFSTIFLLNQFFGQASTFITFSGLMLLIYLFAENRFLNLDAVRRNAVEEMRQFPVVSVRTR